MVQIIIESIWYCRLLAAGDSGVPTSTDELEKEGEEVCDKPRTSRNNLPAKADAKKHYYTTCIQLIVISRILKKKIVMIRTSGTFARDSVKLDEVVSLDNPLNIWKCKSDIIKGLVDAGCEFYASSHSAFYCRLHPRVCILFNLLV